jgi:hypothetical protein
MGLILAVKDREKSPHKRPYSNEREHAIKKDRLRLTALHESVCGCLVCVN